MGKNRINQTGSTLLIALSVMAVVALVGVTSWAVFKHKSTKSDSATETSQTKQKETAAPSNTTLGTANQSITITQWGVMAPYSGNLKLSYTLSPDGKTAAFSSDQLTNLSSDCAGRGGFILRWASNDKVSSGTADANTPTAAAYFASADQSTYAHVENYYYSFQHDQAACGDPAVTATQQSQTNNAVKGLVPNLRASAN